MKRRYIYEYHIETTDEGVLLVCSERNLRLQFSYGRDIHHAVSMANAAYTAGWKDALLNARKTLGIED